MYATVDKTYIKSNLLKENYIPHKSHTDIKENYEDTSIVQENKQPNNLENSKINHKNNINPSVWGPPYWYTLHTSAVHYPLYASPIVKERMKNRILAIPYEIPCALCRSHANAFIEIHKNTLDNIVSDRHSLGRFYVDFHNSVNKRYNKPEWTYEEAYKYYSGK